jgi:hypothetical protein
VSRRAQHVHIDRDRLRAFCAELLAEPGRPAGLDPAHHLLGCGGDTLAYVITLDAINFGSGWFPYIEKRPGLSGYFTVAHALRERFEARGPWSAAELAQLDGAECARVLGQPTGVPELAELMDLYARALRDLGRFLEERHAGRFEGVIEHAGGSCAALVCELASMPLYRDVERYHEIEVPFYKRAQLTAADLASAFGGEGPGHFDDLAQLTLFADNLVPHVLRREGVLVYQADLASRIDRGEPIEAGSREEVELRAASVHAVEGCVEESRRLGADVSAQQLDYRLWTRGQRPEYKAHPRHRTRTSYY